MRTLSTCISILTMDGTEIGDIAKSIGLTRDQLSHFRRGGNCPDEVRRKLDTLVTKTIGQVKMPVRHAWNAPRRASR